MEGAEGEPGEKTRPTEDITWPTYLSHTPHLLPHFLRPHHTRGPAGNTQSPAHDESRPLFHMMLS